MPRVIITVPEKTPQPYRFKLDRKVVTLGRGSSNDIVIDSGSVSGKHAEMHRVEGGYELADLGSTNGIKYGGSRQQVLTLRSGISVKLGDVAFDFTLTEEELETLGREKPAQESPVMKEEPEESESISAEDLPEAKPERAERKSARKAADETEESSSSPVLGFAMVILFLVLAAVAFYAGLDIRHRKETGETLLKGIVNKPEAQKTEPAPVTADDKKPE